MQQSLLEDVAEEDRQLLENVLAVLRDNTVCTSWKVEVGTEGWYVVRGLLPGEVFEVDAEDLHNVRSVSPGRVVRVCVSRGCGRSEVVVRVLNAKQPVLVSESRVIVSVKRQRWC
jgi:hypothetical protein